MPDDQEVTPFGLLTPDRLIYNARRGWLARSSPKEILFDNVISVKLEIKRYRFFGITFLFIALILLMLDSFWMLVAIAPLFLAVLLLLGLPSVKVNTTDEGDLHSAIKPPWTRPEAEWFVATVDRRRQ